MSSLFKLQDKFQSTHGWDVELACGQCKSSNLPRYEGWSSSLTTNTPHTVIFAKVACPKCGKRLTEEAGRKLAELFRGIDISEQNKKILKQFITRLFLVPAVLAFVLFFGMQMDWWGWGLGSVWILLASAISIPVLVAQKNRQVAQLPFQCECGKPHSIFMGSLENSYCYRCFSCGTLLKVRE